MRTKLANIAAVQFVVILIATAIATLYPLRCVASDVESSAPLEALLGELIAGGEWRTENPDYEPGGTQPSHYGVRYRWGPYKQHVTGELVGLFPADEGEREVRYWTLYAFYNPVSKTASAIQIGWNGSMASGTAYRDENGALVIEQTFYGIDGSRKEVRHLDTMDESGLSFRSEVFEKTPEAGWRKARGWQWRKYMPGEDGK